MEAIDKKILECERKILHKQKQVHPVYNKIDLIADGVSIIEKRIST